MAKSSTETTVQWILRDREEKMFSAAFHPDFHARTKEYCEAHQMNISRLIRYAVSREIQGL